MTAPQHTIPGNGRSCPKCGQTIHRIEVHADRRVVAHLNKRLKWCILPLKLDQLRALAGEPDPVLTGREHEVVALMAQGRTLAECAQILSISEGTVSNYRHCAVRKLGAVNSIHAIALAYQRGLLPHIEYPVVSESPPIEGEK